MIAKSRLLCFGKRLFVRVFTIEVKPIYLDKNFIIISNNLNNSAKNTSIVQYLFYPVTIEN